MPKAKLTSQMHLQQMLESTTFRLCILGLILLNALTMGLETLPGLSPQLMTSFTMFNMFVVVVFALEIALKLLVYRTSFFKNGWHVFDFVVVLVSLLPMLQTFSALRVLRAFRVLRVFSTVPQFQAIIRSFFQSLPGVGAIVMILMTFFYAYALIGINLFGAAFPQLFGSLPQAIFTLFQLMTLEGWVEIARPLLSWSSLSGFYIFSYILVTTFIFLNMVIAIITNVMSEEQFQSGPDSHVPTRTELMHEIKALQRQVAQLHKSTKR